MTHLPHSTMQYTLENIRTKNVRAKKFRTQTILGLSFLLVGVGGAFGGFFAATLSSSPSPSETVLFGEVEEDNTNLTATEESIDNTDFGAPGQGGGDEVAGGYSGYDNQQPDNQQPDDTLPTSTEEPIENSSFGAPAVLRDSSEGTGGYTTDDSSPRPNAEQSEANKDDTQQPEEQIPEPFEMTPFTMTTLSSDEGKTIVNFGYIGVPQTFTAPQDGRYTIELRGAKGADNGSSAYGGKGSYTKGDLYLTGGTAIYLYLGAAGVGELERRLTRNGGGEGSLTCYNFHGGKSYHNEKGGGASDVRLVAGAWNDTASLRSRIMVAAAGGGGGGNYGGAGGALQGIDGGYLAANAGGVGASQLAGGANGGTFGIGGTSVNGAATCDKSGNGGGGGGYRGGGGGRLAGAKQGGGGAGGSSFISGYTGAIAILSESSTSPRKTSDTSTNCNATNAATDVVCSYHYSNMIFTDPVMIAGNAAMPSTLGVGTMTGNNGAGYARIIAPSPTITSLSYDPSQGTRTSGNITVTVTLSQIGAELAGWTVSGATFTKVFTENWSGTVIFTSEIGGTVTTYISISTIDTTAPTIDSILPDTTSPTSGTVTLTVTANDAGVGLATEAYSFDDGATRQSQNTKTFTENTTGTIKVRDALGNESSTGFSITNIDTTAPFATTIDYDPTTITSGNVIVTLTLSETGTVPGRTTTSCATPGQGGSGEATGVCRQKTYSNNITTTINFYDLVGNAGSTGLQITRIDTEKPSIINTDYNPATATSGDVLVTITANKPISQSTGRTATGVITNGTQGSEAISWQKTYSNNTDDVFIITDTVGNTGIAEVHINYIDKITPTINSVTQDPTSPTSGNVTLTIHATDNATLHAQAYSFNDGTTRQSADNKTFTGNTNGTIKVRDTVGNESSTGFSIANIDTTAPFATNVNYSPDTATNKNVTVTLSISEPIQALTGWTLSGDATTWTKTYDNNTNTIIYFYDLVGNIGSTGLKIDRIDTEKPSIIDTNYNPATATSGDVIVTITANKPIGQSTGRTATGVITNGTQGSEAISWQKTYSNNTDDVFTITDDLGNTGIAEVHINYIDKIAPTINSVTQDTTSPTSGNVTLTVNATDNAALHTQAYSFDNGATRQSQTTKTFTGNTSGTIKVRDAVGNETNTGFTIANIDITAPTITLNGDNPQYVEVHTPYIEAGATVNDNHDKNLTATIDASNVNTGTLGTYYISYTAIDSAGNHALTGKRKVIVRDTTPPMLTLNGNGDIILEVHSYFVDEGANRTDNYDGSGTAFSFSGTINTGTVGDYVLEYRYVDTNGNTGNVVSRTVHIVDTTAPICSLTYHPDANTTTYKDVIATLTGCSETIIVNSSYEGGQGGSGRYHTFTGNDSFTFEFVDTQGNTGSSIATVTRIDKDMDSDNDGVPDLIEDQDGTDINNSDDFKDSDGDGVPDYIEDQESTDKNDPDDFKDSDGDGVPDYIEDQENTDKNDSDDFKDSDGDGVPDYVEEQESTDKNDSNDFKDSDGDGVPDYVEDQESTNKNDPDDFKDSDGDGVPDYVEDQESTDKNDPNDFKDSDGDGVPDYVEQKNEETTPPAPTNQGGGGGGTVLYKDNCPNGDFSPSYYDKTCTPFPTVPRTSYREGGSDEVAGDFVDTNEHKTSPTTDNLQFVYQRAFQQGITTMPTLEAARLNDTITRAEMAKMISVYAENVLGITPPSLRDTSPAVLREGKQRNLSIMQEDKNNETPTFSSRSTAGVAEGGGAMSSEQCIFSDLNQAPADFQPFIIQACELGLMGLNADGKTPQEHFNPNETITLAEVATIVSRLLREEKYKGSEQWRYHSHLLALQKADLIPRNVDPMRPEPRGNVFVLLKALSNI